MDDAEPKLAVTKNHLFQRCPKRFPTQRKNSQDVLNISHKATNDHAYECKYNKKYKHGSTFIFSD